ncbi:MAG: type II toxin-antitoxin system Phd/YefM family antitoxin [Pyrinomonadaceae bacterium]
MKFSRDIQSLSVFKRDSAKFLRQLKETGEPIVLTVNGKAAMVLFDPDEYQQYLRLKEGDPTIELVPKKGEKQK